MTSRRRNRKVLGSVFLTCLMCAAVLFVDKIHALSFEAVQKVSPKTQLNPLPLDEYKKLHAKVLKKASVLSGPKLKNPAISSDGLAPNIVSAFQEQRTYLKTHGMVILTRAATDAATRMLGSDNSERPPSQRSTCRQPVIHSVNGKASGVVFTPKAANNIYKIEGCSFGNMPGIVRLEALTATPEARSIPPITLRPDSASPEAWSDDELNVQLDPQVRGLPDYPVSLVVYPASGGRIEMPGCLFVAVRSDPQLLRLIPSLWVKLYPSEVGLRSVRQVEYLSPTQASAGVLKEATATSALVVRTDPEPFGVGRDIYDFSQLNPGWVVESVQLLTYSISCPDVITSVQTRGRWETDWTSLGIRVAFEDSVCTSSVPPSFVFNMSLSQYAIRVWVVGPAGTQPLTLVR